MKKLLFLALLALGSAGCFQNLSEADLSDPAIKARIDAQLQAQKGLDLRYVTIDVHSRIVTVSGLVRTYEDKTKITRLVDGVGGVDQLIINLIVQE